MMPSSLAFSNFSFYGLFFFSFAYSIFSCWDLILAKFAPGLERLSFALATTKSSLLGSSPHKCFVIATKRLLWLESILTLVSDLSMGFEVGVLGVGVGDGDGELLMPFEEDKVTGEERVNNSCLRFKTLWATCQFVVFNNFSRTSLWLTTT